MEADRKCEVIFILGRHGLLSWTACIGCSQGAARKGLLARGCSQGAARKGLLARGCSKGAVCKGLFIKSCPQGPSEYLSFCLKAILFLSSFLRLPVTVPIPVYKLVQIGYTSIDTINDTTNAIRHDLPVHLYSCIACSFGSSFGSRLSVLSEMSQ